MDALGIAQITVSYTANGIKFYGGKCGYDFGCQLFVFWYIVNAMWTPERERAERRANEKIEREWKWDVYYYCSPFYFSPWRIKHNHSGRRHIFRYRGWLIQKIWIER